MGFKAFPESGPMTVDGQQTSPLFKFFVPREAEETFLRFIALWRDNEPLGGEAPTFQISASGGVIISVGPNSGDVSVPDGGGETVGIVHCQRLPKDIYLLSISNLVENSDPWKIRIKNNDAESLRFLGFSSHHEEETLQPWMILGSQNAPHGEMMFSGDGKRLIEVRNWGTAPLTFSEVPGTPLGDEDSPIVLAEHPGSVAPHKVGLLTLKVDKITFSRRLAHLLRCNDTIDSHRQLAFRLEPGPAPHPPVAPPLAMFCRRGCGCQEFLEPALPGNRCSRGICKHSLADHLPI